MNGGGTPIKEFSLKRKRTTIQEERARRLATMQEVSEILKSKKACSIWWE